MSLSPLAGGAGSTMIRVRSSCQPVTRRPGPGGAGSRVAGSTTTLTGRLPASSSHDVFKQSFTPVTVTVTASHRDWQSDGGDHDRVVMMTTGGRSAGLSAVDSLSNSRHCTVTLAQQAAAVARFKISTPHNTVHNPWFKPCFCRLWISMEELKNPKAVSKRSTFLKL